MAVRSDLLLSKSLMRVCCTRQALSQAAQWLPEAHSSGSSSVKARGGRAHLVRGRARATAPSSERPPPLSVICVSPLPKRAKARLHPSSGQGLLVTGSVIA